MFWTEDVAAKCGAGPQVVNDSKTPSGRVHVGALRGVLIHDAIFRTLREKGMPVRYLFGVDDYDPVDEIPKGEDEHFGQYIGRPLCNTPAPCGAEGDMADFYMREFWQVFEELGVKVERYRMRDIYRSGKFDTEIDTILRNADKVRAVYKEVSGAVRPDHWYPFQVICENCQRIGTTEVHDYDGSMVSYRCLTTRMVNTKLKLGQGCGHEGKISPFGGNGKLPWKLEWVAKWKQFPVTIEGAGKDHSTRGGSRDVSAACYKAIYGLEEPLRVPYEFFLVGGAKMSSSKGLGASARDMANLLPADTLRFLMIRTKPNSPVNFDVKKEEGIVKLFNEFDRAHTRYFAGQSTPDEAMIYRLACIGEPQNYKPANIQLATALVQMPHLDAHAELVKRLGGTPTPADEKHLDERLASAREWVANYAEEEEKTRLQETLPARAQELSQTQRAFLHALADALPAQWEDDVIQATVFEVARLTPIEQPQAFKALYRVFLDREAGPKAGNLLAFLDRAFVEKRCRELPCEVEAFWKESASTPEALEKWLEKEKEKIASETSEIVTHGALVAREYVYTMQDGKRVKRRVVTGGVQIA